MGEHTGICKAFTMNVIVIISLTPSKPHAENLRIPQLLLLQGKSPLFDAEVFSQNMSRMSRKIYCACF
jgi:hypothetical protein